MAARFAALRHVRVVDAAWVCGAFRCAKVAAIARRHFPRPFPCWRMQPAIADNGLTKEFQPDR
jgi:hypothetical protein